MRVGQRRPLAPLLSAPLHQAGRRRFLRLAGGGLLIGVMGAASCGGEGESSTTVNMTDALRFDPETVTVGRGGTVTWTNTSQIPHTATCDPKLAVDPAHVSLPAGAEPWDSGLVQQGASWSRTFETPGTYQYFCVPHETAGMIGHVVVKG